jgi:colanic acid/amylovoran biosynthesis glycosyltransferase
VPTPPAKVVAVLRREWLRPSETFVRDHAANLTRWAPVTGAFLRVPAPLTEPDCTVATLRPVTEIAYRYGPRRPWSAALSRRLAARGTRLMHVHFGPDALDLLDVRARLDVPLFVTFHGYDVSATRSPVMREYFAHVAEVFAAAHTLIAVSGFVADRLRELGAPPDKIQTHVNGIGLARFTGPARPDGTDASDRRDRPDSADASVLFVGRLVEKKGLGDLLSALARPELRGTRVDVVGDGELGPQLRRRAQELGLEVTFHDQASHERVAELMRRARLVCIPSRTAADGDSEGLPTVAVEAAATGVPIVATRHAGMPEIVVDGVNGLLSPEGDVAALAANLARLLEYPELARRYGQAGREIARTRFDMRTQVARLEALYDSAVAET